VCEAKTRGNGVPTPFLDVFFGVGHKRFSW